MQVCAPVMDSSPVLTSLYFLLLFIVVRCKVYKRCELARELIDVHEIPQEQVATWVCIAYRESSLNTSAVNHGSGDHGLFQISQQWWCSPPGDGFACGISCASLEDDDIEDDVICARRVYRAHQRMTGDGFTAWVVYPYYCKDKERVKKYVEGCFENGHKNGELESKTSKIDHLQHISEATMPLSNKGDKVLQSVANEASIHSNAKLETVISPTIFRTTSSGSLYDFHADQLFNAPLSSPKTISTELKTKPPSSKLLTESTDTEKTTSSHQRESTNLELSRSLENSEQRYVFDKKDYSFYFTPSGFKLFKSVHSKSSSS